MCLANVAFTHSGQITFNVERMATLEQSPEWTDQITSTFVALPGGQLVEGR